MRTKAHVYDIWVLLVVVQVVLHQWLCTCNQYHVSYSSTDILKQHNHLEIVRCFMFLCVLSHIIFLCLSAISYQFNTCHKGKDKNYYHIYVLWYLHSTQCYVDTKLIWIMISAWYSMDVTVTSWAWWYMNIIMIIPMMMGLDDGILIEICVMVHGLGFFNFNSRWQQCSVHLYVHDSIFYLFIHFSVLEHLS